MENILENAEERVIEEAGVHAELISPTDGHYFFGYYDLQPFDSTGRYHLCHKAPFEDRIPGPEDVCELGMLDIQTKEFIKLAETTAWNFQQGALLQWYKDDDHIIFNVREDGAFRTCILNIRTGVKRVLPMAYASLSQDGSKAVCVNFSRIFDFRPGYGYAGIPDAFEEDYAPEADGVWFMDTETGACRLVVSCEQIKEACPKKPYTDQKLLINHITLNPSGDRFVMLFRNQPEDGSKWATGLIVGDMQGNLRQLGEWTVYSHYHWKNDHELLIVSKCYDGNPNLGLYVFNLITGEITLIPEPCPERPIKDIHCLYSPDRRFIMGDDYPIRSIYRRLHFIEIATGKHTILGKYRDCNFSNETMEFRCDLHARYDRTGRYVSFDCNYTGNRCVAMLDLKDLEGFDYHV